MPTWDHSEKYANALWCVVLETSCCQINGANLKNGNLTCAFVCEQKSACDILIRKYSYSQGKTVILPPFRNTVDFFEIGHFPKKEKYPQNQKKMYIILKYIYISVETSKFAI